MTERIEYIIKIQDQISGQLKNIQKNVEGMNSSIDKSTGFIKKFGIAAAAAFAVNKIIDFGTAIVQTGAKFEAYEIGLSTLTGSAEKAREVFNNIKKDAQTTPFNTESLLMANRALISTGLDAGRARVDVLNLANAIAATGGGDDELTRMSVNLQQIRNTGKATALDIKQFAYAGINIYELLARSTGKSVDQVKNMEVTYDQLSKALEKAHDAGGLYAGGLEKMGKSTQVQLSNIKDTISFLMVDIFKAIKPAIDASLGALNNIIGGIKDNLPKILDAFKPLWAVVQDVAGTLFGILKEALPGILALLGPIIEGFRMVWTLVKEIIRPIQEQLAPLLDYLKELFQFIIDIFREFMPVLGPIFKLIGAVAGLVIKIAVGIEKARLALWKWLASISWVQAVFSAIKNGIMWVVDKIMWAIKAAETALKWLGIIEESKAATPTAASAAEAVSNATANKGTGKTTGITPVKDIMTSKPEAAKLTNINISIQDLVKNFSIVTQKLDASEGQVKEFVVKTLLGAVNGFNVVPGQ